MTDYFLQMEGKRLVKILPVYLAVQGIMLLMTFLDLSHFQEAYQENQNLTITPWLGGWFVLEAFGLAIGLILALSKTWKMVFAEHERGKLASGYFLGAIIGLFTLGLRYLPIMGWQYFIIAAGLTVILAVVYFARIRRSSRAEEMFP